jgi:cytosine/uracil/thiamine/allantoin permease
MDAKYRGVSVFLFAMAVGLIGMQNQLTEVLLPFVPEEYRALVSLMIALAILGVREVVKEYGGNVSNESEGA